MPRGPLTPLPPPPPPPPREAECRAGRLDAPAHAKSWYSSGALVDSSRTPKAPYSLPQAGLQYASFRESVVVDGSPPILNDKQAHPPLPPSSVPASSLLLPLVSRMEARASVNTIEIESWLGGRPQTTYRDDGSPLPSAVSQQSAATVQAVVRPTVVIPRSQTVPANAHSEPGHQRREGATLATPQAYMMSSPASFRSAAPFSQHHTLGLPTPSRPPVSRPYLPPPQRPQHKVRTPQSPLHARFVTARSHTMSISSGKVVDAASLSSPSASNALRYDPDDPFQALRRPSVVGANIQPLPSFATRHGPSDSTTSLLSNVSGGSKSIARKATKILGLPPPPDSPYGEGFYADPPRQRFVSHGLNTSIGSLTSAQSPSTASQLFTPRGDGYSPVPHDSPGYTARGLFVPGGGGQPVPSKAQKLLGLMPTKAERIFGIAEKDSSSSGHGSSNKHLSAISTDSSWDDVHGYDEYDGAISVDKVALEPPRLPDLRPPSGSFESLLLSFSKPASPVPSPRSVPRPQGARRVNALPPDARESHFLPGSPTILARKNSKRLRLQSSVQSLRQQAARYTILSATLSPRAPPDLEVVAPKASMKSLRSAASAQMHVLAVSPIPAGLQEALAQTHGAAQTLEEWEQNGWSDDGCGPTMGASSVESGTLDVGELMLFSPGTTEESGEVVQASIGRLSRAVSLADVSSLASLAPPPPVVPALPKKPQPSAYRVLAQRSDTTTSATTQSSFNSTHTCSQPTVLLRTSSSSRPQRLLHRAPLPVELVFSAASPAFYLSAKRYTTLIEFLSSSPGTTFKVFTGGAPRAASGPRVVYVMLSEENDTYGLGTGGDDTFTLSFSLHAQRVPTNRPTASSADDHASLGVGAIMGQSAAHRVARIAMRPHETIGDLLERLGSAQVGALAPEA